MIQISHSVICKGDKKIKKKFGSKRQKWTILHVMILSKAASMFVVDLLPIELVLGFNRGLKVIEGGMDELFSRV